MQNLIGQTIANRYRVDSLLGRGGMAEVYKVWDHSRMTPLALKLLHEDLAMDKVFLRRFKREAETLAKLQHPHIVRFYGLGQDGLQAFMLMDFIEGITLKQKIFTSAQSGLPLEEIREVSRSICSALGYAHKEGLVHCDLKPGNVMLKPDGKVLLMDFGIARLTDAATATMVGAGTPAYMAPEQVKGLDPIPQMDIYALGVVLFEMLTGGERPFTGETATTTGSTSAKVRWEQVNAAPPSPREYNPAISVELEAVVLKCLEKDPRDRFQSALEIQNALELTVDGGNGKAAETVLKSETEDKNISPTLNFQPPNFKPSNLQPVPDQPEPIQDQHAKIQTLSWMQRFGGWIGAGGLLAAALAVILLGNGQAVLAPRPTETPWPTKANTLVPSPTVTRTPTNTPLPSNTPLPTLAATPVLGIGSTRISSADGMRQVYIPAGEFMMGGEDGTAPVHSVYLEAFWMDEHEVTLEQFQGFMAEENYTAYPCRSAGNQPVVCVNWYDAQAYCEWRGARIPTEEEWEKAARGGLKGNKYPWGNHSPICEEGAINGARYDDDKQCNRIGSAPVMSYSPNGYGLYDMAGNVWEWVADWYDVYPGGYPGASNYFGEIFRVLRGGSWLNDEDFLRAATREAHNPESWNNKIGFRCASASSP